MESRITLAVSTELSGYLLIPFLNNFVTTTPTGNNGYSPPPACGGTKGGESSSCFNNALCFIRIGITTKIIN